MIGPLSAGARLYAEGARTWYELEPQDTSVHLVDSTLKAVSVPAAALARLFGHFAHLHPDASPEERRWRRQFGTTSPDGLAAIDLNVYGVVSLTISAMCAAHEAMADALEPETRLSRAWGALRDVAPHDITLVSDNFNAVTDIREDFRALVRAEFVYLVRMLMIRDNETLEEDGSGFDERRFNGAVLFFVSVTLAHAPDELIPKYLRDERGNYTYCAGIGWHGPKANAHASIRSVLGWLLNHMYTDNVGGAHRARESLRRAILGDDAAASALGVDAAECYINTMGEWDALREKPADMWATLDAPTTTLLIESGVMHDMLAKAPYNLCKILPEDTLVMLLALLDADGKHVIPVYDMQYIAGVTARTADAIERRLVIALQHTINAIHAREILELFAFRHLQECVKNVKDEHMRRVINVCLDNITEARDP